MVAAAFELHSSLNGGRRQDAVYLLLASVTVYWWTARKSDCPQLCVPKVQVNATVLLSGMVGTTTLNWYSPIAPGCSPRYCSTAGAPLNMIENAVVRAFGCVVTS